MSQINQALKMMGWIAVRAALCILAALLAPFATDNAHPFIDWLGASMVITFGASLLPKVMSEYQKATAEENDWLQLLDRAFSVARQILSWIALGAAISYLIALITLKYAAYPYPNPIRPPAWRLQWVEISLYITFWVSLLTLPRWQSVVGFGSILLSILMAYGA